MAKQVEDTVSSPNVVVWPLAVKHLQQVADIEFRKAAKSPNEFERGRHAGRGEMAEELKNLPEALAVLAEEDERGKRRGNEQAQ